MTHFVITFIKYAQNGKFGKPNNFKMFRSNKTKEPKKMYSVIGNFFCPFQLTFKEKNKSIKRSLFFVR